MNDSATPFDCCFISREGIAKAVQELEDSEDWSIYRDSEKWEIAFNSCVPKGWAIGVIDCSVPGRARSTLRRIGKAEKLWHERLIFSERNVPLIVGGTAGTIVESIVNAARDARSADRLFLNCLSPEERMSWSGDL